MRISFNQVVPTPMQDQNLLGSQLWNKILSIEPGTRVLIKAPSGTGKSTLQSYISGIRNDFTGEIVFDGKEFKQHSLADWASVRAEKIAIVFQELKLLPELSVRQNLLLKNKLTNRFTEDEIKGFVTELGIEEKWNKPCGQLSLGQQQRVAIIRAVLQPFSLLVADEPFSHLDDENTARAAALMDRRIKEENAGLILLSLGPDYGMNFNQQILL